ncbi:methyltransferase domain-containing protein [Geminicoccaceae bacterium 1502E]|nr:methyltransferase domain-containing protein [Geminicoccaceae bacterium 1502E]
MARSADVYGRTDELDGPTLQAIARRLEARGAHPRYQRMIGDYLDRIDLDGVQQALDLGCGTGVAARTLARRRHFAGRVLGIDLSPALVERARALAGAELPEERVQFEAGDARALALPDASFDVIIAHTLLSHVADPLAVVREAARLVRPGGRIVLCDGDYASLSFVTEAEDGGEGTDRMLREALVTNPRVMRTVPRLLAGLDMPLECSFAYVVSDIGRADFFAAALDSFRVLLPRSGVLEEARAAAYVDALEAASARGVFFASSNFYTFIARRPA